MKKYSLLFLIGLNSLIACGPKIQDKERAPVSAPDQTPAQELKPMVFADADFAKENKIKSKSVFDNLKQIELMSDIASINENPTWSAQAAASWAEQEKKWTLKKMSFSHSAYLDVVYDQIHDGVGTAVKDADKTISNDTQKLVAMIRKEQTQNLKLDAASSLKDKLKVAQDFLNSLQSAVKKLDLLPEFKDTFTVELKKKSQSLLAEAVSLDDNLARAKNLSESLAFIKTFIEKTAVQLSAEDQANLNTGTQLASSLDHMTDAATGLQALALVWSILNDEQRVEYFQAASGELYKFLHGKSNDDIQCMINKNCHGLKNKIVFSVGVYPAIEKFGLQNIADLINQKGKVFIDQKVNQVAFESLQNIGENITDQILTSVNDKKKDLGNFKDKLRENLGEGLSTVLIHLKVKTPQILMTNSDGSLLDFDTQTTYLREKIKLLPQVSDKAEVMQLQMEIVEGLLSLQLYSRDPNDKSKVMQGDLADLIVKPQPRQYLNSPANIPTEVRLNQQSELLATAALAMNELADWKQTAFDQGLTQIQASQILTQFKTQDLNRSFFPKPDLVALGLSLASQVLKQLQSSFSPIVLVNNQNEILPVQSLDGDDPSPIALAAATSFEKGKRVASVHASELATFLSALTDLYRSLDGIEKTQSDLLKKTGAQGISLLQEVLNARQRLKLLIVATANFISNQMIQDNGLISSEVVLNQNLTPSQNYELLDQTRSIDALIHAYEITQIDVYLWTSKRIFQSMNDLLYSDKIKFYQQDTTDEVQDAIDSVKLLETYKNLLKLKKYLTSPQQNQLENLYSAWLKA